jgi:alanyl-tRNA synthetase
LRVVDVAVEDDVVVHWLAEAPPNGITGRRVQGHIDWPRRYDHMQQHSGQHLLSQTLFRLHGLETVSVHFGADESTLDVDAERVSAAQLDDVESAANDLVFAALPITAYFVDDRAIVDLPLRRPPKVSGQIRIVEIAGYDWSACGGTHVRTTAEIGPVKLLKQERKRGQTRLTFKCGLRALADYRLKHRLITEAAALFTTEIGLVPEMIARNQAQIKQLQAALDDLAQQQLTQEAQTMLQTAPRAGAYALVTGVFPGREVDAVKALAALLQAEAGTVALLAATHPKPTLIVARAAGAPLHAGNLLATALAAFGGKGGGRPEYAQGGGIAEDQLAALLAYAAELVRKEIG